MVDTKLFLEEQLLMSHETQADKVSIMTPCVKL